uniref:F104A protein n=1 Tax=Oncorhynchus tshawytscha TaxID=74940 RepID=A0AAZ3SV51_ONCTS
FVFQSLIRKRQRSGGEEENGQLVPKAKRLSRGANPSLLSWAWMPGTRSESRGISSPDHAVGSSSSSQCAVDSLSGAQPLAPGPCSPLSSALSSELADPTNLVSYHQINRILREAHFESLQCRGHPRDA